MVMADEKIDIIRIEYRSQGASSLVPRKYMNALQEACAPGSQKPSSALYGAIFHNSKARSTERPFSFAQLLPGFAHSACKPLTCADKRKDSAGTTCRVTLRTAP